MYLKKSSLGARTGEFLSSFKIQRSIVPLWPGIPWRAEASLPFLKPTVLQQRLLSVPHIL